MTERTAQPTRPGVILAVLSLGGAAYALLQSLVVPALPVIQKDLHTSTSGVAWVFTAYLLAASVVTPIAGRLGDMYGKKRVLVIALGGLTVGSALGGLASTLPVMITARTIQGLGGRDLPARVRDRARSVPARARRVRDRDDLGDPRDRRRARDHPRRADPRQRRLPLAVLDPAVRDADLDGRGDLPHSGVDDPCARQRALAGRSSALGVADRAADRGQRGADVGLGLAEDASACSSCRASWPPCGCGRRLARSIRSSTCR